MLLTGPRALAGDDRVACAKSSEEGQNFRDSGQLLRAYRAFAACAQDSCPSTIKRDCLAWFEDIEANLPTVVFSAKDIGGEDLATATVSYDDQPLTTQLDGNAVFVDPGSHRFRFESPNRTPVELDVVIREGEKNRLISAQFRRLDEPAQSPPAVDHDPSQIPDQPQERSKPSVLPALIVGSAGVLALGIGATFWAVGLGEKSTLESTCGVPRAGQSAGSCTDDQISTSRTKLIIGDVAAGIGVVGIGVASYLLFTEMSARPTAPASPNPLQSARVDVRPTPGGAFASFAERF